jgi:pimeloyl-ACP methyl ester carboxylesterase
MSKSPCPFGEGATSDLLANNTYRAFEKSGHYPHFAKPALFDAALLEWLKRN